MNNNLEADMGRLMQLAKEGASGYQSAQPYPHAMIEDFIDPDLLQRVCDEFPDPQGKWGAMVDKDQKKFAHNVTEEFGPATRQLIHFLNGREIINFLEALTGIEGLVPDPHLAGGGLHELRAGGFLKVHADFNWHNQLRLDRRINLLIYLNRDWKPEYGGAFEFWDNKVSRKLAEYLPTFNRCVIFNTTDHSFHGNPVPVACPPGRTRRSIAMYYYSNGRPAGETSESHGTLFRNRPGEASSGEVGVGLLKRMTPPIVLDAWRALKGKP